jgi:hypothetical protein
MVALLLGGGAAGAVDALAAYMRWTGGRPGLDAYGDAALRENTPEEAMFYIMGGPVARAALVLPVALVSLRSGGRKQTVLHGLVALPLAAATFASAIAYDTDRGGRIYALVLAAALVALGRACCLVGVLPAITDLAPRPAAAVGAAMMWWLSGQAVGRGAHPDGGGRVPRGGESR